MTDENRCKSVGSAGFQCSREAGHDNPVSDPTVNSANPRHVAKNEDGATVQIWLEVAEDAVHS